jgi:membrane fusion protein (multidrug efflux system)
VVNHSGILAQRNIISKMRIPDFYVVASGLTKEEKILFEGVANVKDGYKIDPVDIELDKAMSIESE